jgi:hypothetical protein
VGFEALEVAGRQDFISIPHGMFLFYKNRGNTLDLKNINMILFKEVNNQK